MHWAYRSTGDLCGSRLDNGHKKSAILRFLTCGTSAPYIGSVPYIWYVSIINGQAPWNAHAPYSEHPTNQMKNVDTSAPYYK